MHCYRRPVNFNQSLLSIRYSALEFNCMKAGLTLVEGWGWECRFYFRNVWLELCDFRSANDNESRIWKRIKENGDWFYLRSFSNFICNDRGDSRKILTLASLCFVIQTHHFCATLPRIITTALTITPLKAMQIGSIDQSLHTFRWGCCAFPLLSCIHSAHTNVGSSNHVITFASDKRFGIVDVGR
jgi:hypothetical protein